MLTAGIDMGAKSTRVIILKDDKEVLAEISVLTGFDQKASAEEAFSKALKKAKVNKEDLKYIVSTGMGREVAPYINRNITEITANAKGAHHLFPSARVVIDVGAEDGRAVRCDSLGNVRDFAVNDKCAAGAGSFVESMSRALELSIDEFAELSLQSKTHIPMNAQCVIFAESEVVSLIHTNTSHADISKAIHDAVADRISTIVRRVGIEKDVVAVGGVARNKGFIDSLKRYLGVDVIVPEEPEYVGALGAALSHD